MLKASLPSGPGRFSFSLSVAIDTGNGTLGTFSLQKRGYRHVKWDVGHVFPAEAWLSTREMGRWARFPCLSVAIDTGNGTLGTFSLLERGYRHGKWDVGHVFPA